MKPVGSESLLGFFEGALGLRKTHDGVQPIRLPLDELDLHHASLKDPFRAEAASGIRMRFFTDSRHVALRVRHHLPELMPAEPVYDLVTGDGSIIRRTATKISGTSDEVRFGPLDQTDGTIELWLPPGLGVIVQSLLLDEGAHVEARADGSPRWVVYGSSITHCAWVPSPTETWPAIAARELGWHLTSLGFNGGCHLDPLIARAMARLPADRFTLKLGINVHNLQTLRERTFAPLVHGFISTLRDKHEQTPITIVSPIISPERETSPVSMIPVLRGGGAPFYGDMTVSQMREILRDVVDLWRRRGDSNIDYLDGRELLGEADLPHLPDGLHPDAKGYALMGCRFAARYRSHKDNR